MQRISPHKYVLIVFILIISFACGVESSGGLSPVDQTEVAVEVQGTLVASQQTKQAQQPAQAPTMPPSQAAQEQVAEPTFTVEVAPAQGETPSAPPEKDIQALISDARILLYEETYSEGYDGQYVDSRIQDALAAQGLTGNNVVKITGAKGDFLSQLSLTHDWDLIIFGTESRYSKDVLWGEFWEAINEHLNRKTALIAEVWYLDATIRGKMAPVVSRCGFDYQANFIREEDADLNGFLLHPLAVENPALRTPNTIGMLIPTSSFAWVDDVGDLIRLTPGSDAEMLLGLHADDNGAYGVAVSCMEGRVIFQTFSTHDYKIADTSALWQNYIVNTLTRHFETMD